MDGNLQKRVSFGFDGCHNSTRANNKAYDLNSINVGRAILGCHISEP